LPYFPRKHSTIGAMSSFVDETFQVLVGCRDDARIDVDRLVVAEPPDFAFLNRAKQLRLERRRRLGDLVEEERAAVGFFEEALACLYGAGERATHVSKELAFEKRLGERRAVDRDERPLGAQGVGVDGPCDQFLAGAALAGDENRCVGGRDTNDASEDVANLRGLPDDVAEVVALSKILGHGA
jgi:hypothetical protein